LFFCTLGGDESPMLSCRVDVEGGGGDEAPKLP
jgi:hypothetical protein